MADENKSFNERRRFVRVDCLMAGNILSIDTQDDVTTGLTKNVSAGGLLFKSKKSYEIGQTLVVSINEGAVKELDENLAGVIKTPAYVLGQIVRKEAFDNGEFYEYGVCFVRNDEEGLDYLNVFVNLINQIEFRDDQ